MEIKDVSPLLDNLVVSREVEPPVEPVLPVVPLKREDYDHEGAKFVDAEGDIITVLGYYGAWDVHVQSDEAMKDKHIASFLLRKPGFTFRDKRIKGAGKLDKDIATCYNRLRNRRCKLCDAWEDREVFAKWYKEQHADGSGQVCALLSADPNAVMGPDNTILAHKALSIWVRASLSSYYDSKCPRHISFNGVPFGMYLDDFVKRPAYMVHTRFNIGFLELRVNYITNIKEAFKKTLEFRKEVLRLLESGNFLSLKNEKSLEIYKKFRKSMLDGTFYPKDWERVKNLMEIEKKYEAKCSERGLK